MPSTVDRRPFSVGENLAEFKLITNGYAAELGRTAGGVINLITKSGTSTFHGSLFEFYRNEKMDAKNFFAGPGAGLPVHF